MNAPHGSILSSLLCNILLHNVDVNMIAYCINKTNLVNSLHAISTESIVNGTLLSSTCKGSLEFIAGTKTASKIDVFKHTYEVPAQIKIQYIRYADSFLCGFVSNKEEVFQTLCFIAYCAFYVGMQLNVAKTTVKHHEKGVFFLGYHIYGNYSHNIKLKSNKSKKVDNVGLQFNVPLNRIFAKFCERGFFQKVKKKEFYKMVSRRVDKWLFLDTPYEVILRFNSVIRGVGFYYSGSTYGATLNRFYIAMKRSAALTLAHMHKKHSAKWALNKYGPELKVFSKTGKVATLLIPEIENHIFRDGELQYALAIPAGTPLPNVLMAKSNVPELNCVIPNCTLKATQ